MRPSTQRVRTGWLVCLLAGLPLSASAACLSWLLALLGGLCLPCCLLPCLLLGCLLLGCLLLGLLGCLPKNKQQKREAKRNKFLLPCLCCLGCCLLPCFLGCCLPLKLFLLAAFCCVSLIKGCLRLCLLRLCLLATSKAKILQRDKALQGLAFRINFQILFSLLTTS